jgi:carbonic anhydrase/acetyltransferase-like protein (isoleucine patch superfamily)
MSAGPASAISGSGAQVPHIATSAVVPGSARLGEGALLAEGAVIRSADGAAEVGTGSAVLENAVVVGNTTIRSIIGRRSVFGHPWLVIGAAIGDLGEIGNAPILMPGDRLGDRVFLGEGTLVPADTTLPNDVAAIGQTP